MPVLCRYLDFCSQILEPSTSRTGRSFAMPNVQDHPSWSRFEIESYRAYAEHKFWLEIMRGNPIFPMVKRFWWRMCKRCIPCKTEKVIAATRAPLVRAYKS